MPVIQFSVPRRGSPVASGPLRYGGRPNRFVAEFAAPVTRVYGIVITAFDPATGNSGVAETTFQVD